MKINERTGYKIIILPENTEFVINCKADNTAVKYVFKHQTKELTIIGKENAN
jgi:hypothetical protein